MDSCLRTIVYVSSAVMPTDDGSVESLLVEARDLNLETYTTGVLLLCDGSFMQCFEGRGAGFDETWDRIRLSRRHRRINVLIDEEIEERSFPDWQMGFFGPTSSRLLAESTARWKFDSMLRRPDCSAGRELLQRFWASNG